MVDIIVRNDAELMKAANAAKGGETIKLAAGTYTSLNLSNKAFTSAVTITSLDAGNPATIGGVKLTNVSNMTFTQIDLGRPFADAAANAGAAMAKLSKTENITFDTVHVHGSLDNNPMNDVQGITIGSSKNIKIVNSEFQQLWKALGIGASENITLANNKVHDTRSDGFDFVAVSKVLIENNIFTDFARGTKDHPDAIQFWTTNSSRPSTDIIIRNNQILQGNGVSVQGIFLRDEKGTLPYENVTIENNLVVQNGMANGISVLGGKNVTVTNNTVVSPSDDKVKVNIRLQSITGGTVSGNISDGMIQGGTGMSVSGNKLTADTSLNSILKNATLSGMTAADLLAPGFGFKLFPSASVPTGGSSPSTPAATAPPTPVIPTPPAIVVTSPLTNVTPTTPATVQNLKTGAVVSKGKVTGVSTTSFLPATLSDRLTGASALAAVPIAKAVSTSTWAAATPSPLLSTLNPFSFQYNLATSRI